MENKWKQVEFVEFTPNGQVLVDVKDIDERTGRPIGRQLISQTEYFKNINLWQGRKSLVYEMNGGG